MEIITIRSGQPLKEKKEMRPLAKIEVLTKIPLKPDHVRCIVLRDFQGMKDWLIEGDIADFPERRYKTLCFRGLVKKYDGEASPNKER